ncbi:putative multidrug efflux transporter (AcrB family); putative acriflavin resistance protein [Bradyrhizobium sp. ORS 278]|nr:putative multidrug efflux transporter (AcrB family); putative acriflavin resistance protein [Bradyrhizobium sp. ORS 278]
MAELSKSFPQGIQYDTPFDTTKFVNASIHEVYKTLIEAGVLVLIVILIFLQDWRAMLVPTTTVPVTIIGAFAAMAALGFTINLSTLFAIVLAIGIVVDDAIVVVEGAAHNIERGMNGHDAAIRAMDQLFAPIVGVTLVLIAVFLPAAFLPGLTGRIYAQFALVIAATALLSAINAAMLKPTQRALWLRPPVPVEKRNIVYRAFNNLYARLERRYTNLIGRLVRHSTASVVIALILIAAGGYGLSRVPTGFLPIEDQGYLIAAMQLPDGASLERTQKALDRVGTIAKATPGVAQIITIAGISALDNSASLANSGVAYIILTDWESRGQGEDLRSLVYGLNHRLAEVIEARSLVLPPPPIQGIGNAAGFAMQVELRDGNSDYAKLQAMTSAIVASAQSQSTLQRVQSPFRAMVPQFDVEIDRVKTQTLHVTTDQVFSALSSYLGASYVNQFNKFGRVFQVYVQADSTARLTPRQIESLMVRNQSGDMIPLGTVATVKPAVGPSLISLYNLYPSATVVGLPAQGYSSGQSLKLMEQIAQQTLPPGAGYEWTAMSYQEKAVSNQIYLTFGLALLLVYLVLAGQYESWYAPVSVILAVPLSLLGPMAVLLLRSQRRLLQSVGVVSLAQQPVRGRVGHEAADEGQRLVMPERDSHRRHRLLEGLVEHPRARDLPGHRVELVARQGEGIDLASLQQAEDLVIGLIAGDAGVLQMRLGAAHRRRVVHGRDLDARLVEGRKARYRRARLDDVGRIRDLVDRAERHPGLALRILRQERHIPGALVGRIGDLAGVLVHDVVDGHTEPVGHRAAEIDGDAGIAGLGPGRPERAARGADRDRHAQLAGGRDLVLQLGGSAVR